MKRGNNVIKFPKIKSSEKASNKLDNLYVNQTRMDRGQKIKFHIILGLGVCAFIATAMASYAAYLEKQHDSAYSKAKAGLDAFRGQVSLKTQEFIQDERRRVYKYFVDHKMQSGFDTINADNLVEVSQIIEAKRKIDTSKGKIDQGRLEDEIGDLGDSISKKLVSETYLKDNEVRGKEFLFETAKRDIGKMMNIKAEVLDNYLKIYDKYELEKNNRIW